MEYDSTMLTEVSKWEALRILSGCGTMDKVTAFKHAYKNHLIIVCVGEDRNFYSVYRYDMDQRPVHEAIIEFAHVGHPESVEKIKDDILEAVLLFHDGNMNQEPYIVWDLMKDMLADS